MEIIPIWTAKLTLEEKESRVRDYYSKSIKFKGRLKPEQIEFLFRAMIRMQENIDQHFQSKPGLRQKFLARAGLSEESASEG
jgi:hypothetical protein